MEIQQHDPSVLEEYVSVSIAFDVESALDVSLRSGGLGGIHLRERRLSQPYRKDYDAEAGNRPTQWSSRFDLSTWGFLIARSNGALMGGVTIAYGSPDLHLLDRRDDLAVLWDARVAPDHRRTGVGTALFEAAESWARSRGCTQLKVETQNINLPACRFYAKQGCTLGGINLFAYPHLPGEVQLLWYKDLAVG